MKFQPKSAKEIAESGLLPEGEYPFEISGGTDKVSKTGNEMIELVVRIYKPDGSFSIVYDYLLESMAYKLRHAAEACGLLHEYESGILLGENFIGKTGTLKLKIQKDKNGVYADKNTISDYIVLKEGETPAPLPEKKAGDDFKGDEIPW